MSRSRDAVLVTGGAGFIGSELVRQLAVVSKRVLVVDNLVNGKRENLEGVAPDRVRLLERDIRETDSFRSELSDVATVFHLACLGVRHSLHAPEENHDVNATGTLRLLQVCQDEGVERFVYVSSSEVYGTARWTPMTEEHPTYPSTVYGASKLAGECYARAFHRSYRYPTVVVRPFNTYGPRSHHEGDSGEVIPKFLLRSLTRKPMVIFGDGTQTRDFTYVSDTARGILLAGREARAIGETINLGSGQEVSIAALAREIAEVTGGDGLVSHDEPRPGDVGRLCADLSRAHEVLGYGPQVTRGDGLRQLLDWYEGHEVPAERLLDDEVVRNWSVSSRTT